MGQFDAGVELANDSVRIARDLDHPFSLCYALYHTAYLHTSRQYFDLSLNCARELQEVAHDKDYQIWEALGKVIEGVSLAGSGKEQEGLTLTETGIGLYQGLTTPPVFWPLILALRSFAHLRAGRGEKALGLIDEAIGFMGGEDSLYPEFLILKGDIIHTEPGARIDDVIGAYRRAGARAHSMQLRGVELHAKRRLVTVLKQQGDAVNELEALADLLRSIEGGAEEQEMVAARRLFESS